MRNMNTEETIQRIKNTFGSNTNILSFNTLRRRVNKDITEHTPLYITSKQLSYVLSHNECLVHVQKQ